MPVASVCAPGSASRATRFYDAAQVAILPVGFRYPGAGVAQALARHPGAAAPSPRNNLWLKRNPWFEAQVLPQLRQRVAEILGSHSTRG